MFLENKVLEIARKVAEKEALCYIASQNCNSAVGIRIYIDKDIVADICKFVSTICGKCQNPKCQNVSKLCQQASEKLANNEGQAYLDICNKAVTSCPYGKEPNGAVKKKQGEYVK